jgi:hypothetical protein
MSGGAIPFRHPYSSLNQGGEQSLTGDLALADANNNIKLAPCYFVLGHGGEIAEFLEIRLLRLVARRQLEQPRRGATQDIVLGLLRQER